MRFPTIRQRIQPGETMNLHRITAKASTAVLAALSAFSLCAGQAGAASPASVSKGLQLATDQGKVDPSKDQVLTVILKLHNQAAFDQAVEALYDPQSPTFHHWFTKADFAKYAPTATDLQTVRQELEKQGLSVVSTDPQNFSIRVHGSTSSVEQAFQTELHNFTYKKQSFQANVRDA